MAERRDIPPTKRGYDLFEVASALQKAIRRSQPDEAAYWTAELDLSGYGEYAWKRLRIIASEDIGLAEPLLPAVLDGLYTTWTALRKKKEAAQPERLQLMHAALLCAHAHKSRYVDNAAIVHYLGLDDGLVRDIPDHALDKHTLRGKQMGRGMEHFFSEGARLIQPVEREATDDPYAERAAQFFLGDEQMPLEEE
jgi:replication-associated recombination protein RarA